MYHYTRQCYLAVHLLPAVTPLVSPLGPYNNQIVHIYIYIYIYIHCLTWFLPANCDLAVWVYVSKRFLEPIMTSQRRRQISFLYLTCEMTQSDLTGWYWNILRDSVIVLYVFTLLLQSGRPTNTWSWFPRLKGECVVIFLSFHSWMILVIVYSLCLHVKFFRNKS